MRAYVCGGGAFADARSRRGEGRRSRAILIATLRLAQIRRGCHDERTVSAARARSHPGPHGLSLLFAIKGLAREANHVFESRIINVSYDISHASWENLSYLDDMDNTEEHDFDSS